MAPATSSRGCILSIQPVAERGGSDQCLLRMVRDLVADGWQCHVVVPGPSPLAREFAQAGALLHVVPMRRITTSGSPAYWLGYAAAWVPTVRALARLARQVDADVVHTNSLHSWYGWAAALLARRPHVWHAREIVVQSAAALRLERVLTRRFATVVVAVSAAVADQLDGAPTVVVHDVPDADEFAPVRAGRFRGRVGIPDDIALVGAAGRIDTWKGFDVVLEAITAVRAARPDAELVVAGGPVPGKEAYEQALAKRASQTDGVHWLGPRDDIADLLTDLDAFVLASTEPEPFATVLAEALTAGVPVVATEHGGSPELLAASGGPGRLVAPGDPEALAEAVVAVLPAGPSSIAARRARRSMPLVEPTSFTQVFAAVLHTPGPKAPPDVAKALAARRHRSLQRSARPMRRWARALRRFATRARGDAAGHR